MTSTTTASTTLIETIESRIDKGDSIILYSDERTGDEAIEQRATEMLREKWGHLLVEDEDGDLVIALQS